MSPAVDAQHDQRIPAAAEPSLDGDEDRDPRFLRLICQPHDDLVASNTLRARQLALIEVADGVLRRYSSASSTVSVSSMQKAYPYGWG